MLGKESFPLTGNEAHSQPKPKKKRRNDWSTREEYSGMDQDRRYDL